METGPAQVYDVEFRAVSKRFGSVVAVDDVDLAVRKGEFLSLLGPSGCGKTTSLRLVAGFEQPTDGRVLIGGVDAVGVPPYKRDVNTVFQHYALFPHMTVLENVAYGLKQRRIARGERSRLALEALELVRLRGLEGRRPKELSGGQQQRVALARALVMRPRVLLLDEPLGALDLKLRKEMQIELKRIQRDVGVTFVYVTHDQEEAMSMSDRIAVMAGGQIEQLGEPLAIYDRPATAFVADFIGDMNFLDGEVVEAADGRFAVAVDGGLIRGLGTAQRGERARVGLRPERITVERGAASGEANRLPGTLVATMYLGDQVQLVAELPGGRQLIAREQRSAGAGVEQLRAGDAVVVAWDESAPLLLGGEG